MMNRTNSSWDNLESGKDLFNEYIGLLKSCLTNMDLDALEKIGDLFDKSCIEGNTIYCAGNGGSAATAAHLSTDLFFGRRLLGETRPKILNLVSNVPLMTALSNDVSYDDVFLEQLNGLFEKGDVLVVISASGNSQNILKAVDFAKEQGGRTVGLVGFDGGNLKSRCDICIHVPTPIGLYELVEDAHHSMCHMLSQYLKFKSHQRVFRDTDQSND